MKNTRISFITVVALVAIFALAGVSYAQVPDVQDGASSVIPSPESSTSSAGGSVPAQDDTVSSNGSAIPPVEGHSTSAGAPVSPEPSNESTDNGRTSSGSRRSSRTSSFTYAPATINASSSCPVITSYMKMGGNNDAAQVSRLQSFLKDTQKADVAVTGVFDQKTEAAVKAFQAANVTTVMGPWGATQPTGVVYITTMKAINQVACKQPLVLTSAELAIINARKQQQDVSLIPTEVGTVEIEMTPESRPTLDVEIGSAQTVEIENVAAVGKTSIAGRFWNFVVSLFK